MTDVESRELEAARAEARYRRERRDLYRARLQTARSASDARLKELDRECRSAETRLSRIEQRSGRAEDLKQTPTKVTER